MLPGHLQKSLMEDGTLELNLERQSTTRQSERRGRAPGTWSLSPPHATFSRSLPGRLWSDQANQGLTIEARDREAPEAHTGTESRRGPWPQGFPMCPASSLSQQGSSAPWAERSVPCTLCHGSRAGSAQPFMGSGTDGALNLSPGQTRLPHAAKGLWDSRRTDSH